MNSVEHSFLQLHLVDWDADSTDDLVTTPSDEPIEASHYFIVE